MWNNALGHTVGVLSVCFDAKCGYITVFPNCLDTRVKEGKGSSLFNPHSPGYSQHGPFITMSVPLAKEITELLSPLSLFLMG